MWSEPQGQGEVHPGGARLTHTGRGLKEFHSELGDIRVQGPMQPTDVKMTNMDMGHLTAGMCSDKLIVRRLCCVNTKQYT